MFNKLPKEKVQVVHDNDIERFLEGLGLLSKFNLGKLKCKFCSDTVTLVNLHSLFPQAGDIKFVCDKQECILAVSDLLREREISI